MFLSTFLSMVLSMDGLIGEDGVAVKLLSSTSRDTCCLPLPPIPPFPFPISELDIKLDVEIGDDVGEGRYSPVRIT